MTVTSAAVRWEDVGRVATAMNTFSSFQPTLAQAQQFTAMLSYADDQDDNSEMGSDTKDTDSLHFFRIHCSQWERIDTNIRVFCEKLTSVSYPMGRAMERTWIAIVKEYICATAYRERCSHFTTSHYPSFLILDIDILVLVSICNKFITSWRKKQATNVII
ncbi:unnamed protein product [Dibothriocephalus latus]|uniref:Uncharacterized protein n=1 Tax=Dibothriocephalus latus TaxID=60516 RepID=A0A3P6SSQ5_DIBLA|nr:unnamed protein product [Dibothriocephalus latus]